MSTITLPRCDQQQLTSPAKQTSSLPFPLTIPPVCQPGPILAGTAGAEAMAWSPANDGKFCKLICSECFFSAKSGRLYTLGMNGMARLYLRWRNVQPRCFVYEAKEPWAIAKLIRTVMMMWLMLPEPAEWNVLYVAMCLDVPGVPLLPHSCANKAP